jgi:hypothetical protein
MGGPSNHKNKRAVMMQHHALPHTALQDGTAEAARNEL